jgi:hypothetical protein
VHFSWVKAHNNPGNELADQLAKEAACDNSLQTAYHKYPKRAVTSELKCLGLQKWQSEWDNTNKGAITKTFPTITDRLTKRLPTIELKPINVSNWAREIKVLPV